MNGTSGSPAEVAHDAFFYETVEEYLRIIVAFVREGAAARQPALVAVPGRKARLLHALLDDGTQEIAVVDMTDLGRNPARIIAALRRFIHAHPGTAPRFVGEPIWPGRSSAEIREAVLHEALLESAVAGTAVAVLCPYDAAGLDTATLADARQTHAHVVTDGERQMSQSYDPFLSSAMFSTPLPPAPDNASRRVFHHGDLAGLRHFVEEGARPTELSTERMEDLLLAVNEVATNTLAHVGSPGTIRLWCDAEALEVVCELSDDGRISEPLVGRFGPYPVSQRGWGLWMVNQVCDLVEIRSGNQGTNVRLHMGLR